MKRIRCTEIGMEDCELEVLAQTVDDVVDEMLAHLRRDHGFNIPEGSIVEGEIRVQSEPERSTVVRLLQVAAAIENAGSRSRRSRRYSGLHHGRRM